MTIKNLLSKRRDRKKKGSKKQAEAANNYDESDNDERKGNKFTFVERATQTYNKALKVHILSSERSDLNDIS